MAHKTYDILETSTAPIETVFAVIADAPRWSEWNKSIARAFWEVEGTDVREGVGAIRSMGAAKGPLSREQIVSYEAPQHLAYTILSGPVPVTNYRADVHLRSLPNGGTEISWKGEFDCRIPGVAAMLTKMVRGFAVGAAREAERQTQIS